ncbi:MAG: Na(+)/H(+) antiporter subunit B, partial [Pseudomonadota bacterium]
SKEEGGLPLSTVLAFDIGVYLVVFGAILTLVFAMEEEI